MTIAKLIHNPGAGAGGPTKERLIAIVESAGFKCSYLSVKEEGWKDAHLDKVDFLIAAGGDGTVKKVASMLLEQDLLHKNLPLGLIPIGTANNIANALGISGTAEEIVHSWDIGETRDYDLTSISGLEEKNFFIEGLGYGIFPFLIQEMKKVNKGELVGSEGKITRALEMLHKIIPTYPARHCHLTVDGKEYQGNFLLAEVMNIPSIGPNLLLAPLGDPGDGEYDVVLVSEEQREELTEYVKDKLNGKKSASFFTTIKAKNVQIHSEETLLHVDDKLSEMGHPQTINVEVMKNSLSFLRTENSHK